ncbi:MAG TPA: GDSL-type esterase/lipase family protein, partial [Phycisphaerales bacterium]|nr:GDSL-type esterase/lipase family protein [Phycisphaerales bacterium]
MSRQVPPATHAANTPAPRADQFWIDRHALGKARAREASLRGDVDVVFLGDSITQGWEGEGRQAWDDAFSGRVVDGLPTPRGLNLGISADRTEHVLYRVLDGTLDPLAAPSSGRPPRLAVIMIGTNNSHGDQYTARQIADGIVAVTRAVQSRLPGIRVLLLNIFPRNVNKDAQRAKVEAASELAWSDLESDSSIRRMDLGGLFTSPDGVLDLELMPDALHLSARGYRVWASAIEPAIKQAIRTGPSPWGTAVVDLRERMRARGIPVRQQGSRDADTVFAFTAALEYAAAGA